MKGKYIDKDLLIKLLNKNATFNALINEIIISIPETEIICCKDCKYYKNGDCKLDMGLINPKEYDYCSYAEREQDE